MRQKINPVVAVIVVIVSIVVLGLVGMKVMDNATREKKVIVLPADPNQTKPDPKLNVDSSGT